MNEWRLRDPNQHCEHDFKYCHYQDGDWCPGGKEIVLRRQPIAVMGGLSPAWYPTDEDPDFDVWVEVSDG